MMFINSQQHYDSAVDYDSRYDAASDLMHTDERKEPTYDATTFKSNAMPRKTHLTVNVHMQQQKQPDLHTASTQYSDYSSNTGSSNEVFSGHSDSSILANTSNPLPHHQLQLSIPVESVQPKRIQRKTTHAQEVQVRQQRLPQVGQHASYHPQHPPLDSLPRAQGLPPRRPVRHQAADRQAAGDVRRAAAGRAAAATTEAEADADAALPAASSSMVQQSMQRTAISSNDQDKFTLKMPSLQSRKYEDSDLQRQTTDRFNALHAQHQQKQLTTPSLPHIAASPH